MGCITDVPGVRVAHLSLHEDGGRTVRTGVTAVLPAEGDLRAAPVPAAAHVVNGYGKPVGLAQVAELGELEAPVVLTGTLGVGAAHEGVVRWLLARDPGLGRPATVNPVVLECNDGRLHDARALAVRPEHVVEALDAAERGMPSGAGEAGSGAVGAGHGMVAFGWKGGVGTASATVVEDVQDRKDELAAGAPAWTLGCLVLANMGAPGDLVVDGRRTPPPPPAAEPVDGSIIVLLATDAPLDARQLGRLARRAQNGLARTGVLTDHGSGEFVLAWTTHRTGAHRRDGAWLRPWFEAAAGVVEVAVLDALRSAVTTTGRDGLVVERCPWLD